jgi:hypothetical protein
MSFRSAECKACGTKDIKIVNISNPLLKCPTCGCEYYVLYSQNSTSNQTLKQRFILTYGHGLKCSEVDSI